MEKPFVILIVLFFLFTGITAQPDNGNDSSEYNYSKSGVLIFETFRNYENIKKSNPDLCKAHLDMVKTFVNELTASSALLTEKRGFDLNVVANGFGNMNEQKNWEHKDFEYGIMSELCFQFQLFFTKGGKWDHYCPNWCFKLNAPLYGKSLPFQGLHSNIKVLNEVFLVFPHAKDIAPGVRFHYNDAGMGELVFFNPNRPDYWLPVLLKEIVNAKLKYFTENEKGVYELYKSQADKLAEAELNEPAFYENSEENFLLEMNGRKNGTPIMRFNPDYWDRSLPRSAIQYFTLSYSEIFDKDSWERERENFFRNNHGRIDYIVEAPVSIIEFKKLSGVIQKK